MRTTLLISLLTVVAAHAQPADPANPGFYRPLSLAPAETVSSEVGGAGDEEKAKAAELAQKLQNPIANLISVPIQSVSQLLKIGKQPISLALGGKYYADGPEGGPDWGLRFVVQLLFPK